MRECIYRAPCICMVAHRILKKKYKYKTKIKKNKIKNENKKIEKHIIQKKKPQNYHGLWVPNLIERFFIQKEKRRTTKFPWPMSAKSHT